MEASIPSPLRADLVEMLYATRDAERDLYAMLAADSRDEPHTIGEWSAKDVRGHLSAWRAIEARRLLVAAGVEGVDTTGDPGSADPEDDSNARLHAERAEWSWDAVAAEADASVAALVDAVQQSSDEALCECNDAIAGVGANGVNHGLAHLSDIAKLAGDTGRFDAYAAEMERLVGRSHLPPRDSGVLLYNLACHRALAGQVDDARRLLRAAFAQRADLVDFAAGDPDLEALNGELDQLATA